MQSSPLLRPPYTASDKKVMRLLRVLASKTDGRLTCKLTQADVTTEYVALSYVWGTSKSQHTINVQSQDLRGSLRTRNMERGRQHRYNIGEVRLADYCGVKLRAETRRNR